MGGMHPHTPSPAESAQGLHAGPRFVSRKGGGKGARQVGQDVLHSEPPISASSSTMKPMA